MKVRVTVTAEFPAHMSYELIEKLAREHGHPAVLQNANVTHGEVAPPDGAVPRRIVKWEVDSVDLKNITSDGVFEAQVMAAAERGIKLERRVIELEPGASRRRGWNLPYSGRGARESDQGFGERFIFNFLFP